MKPTAYAASGVDLKLGNRVKGTLPRLLAATRRRGVMGKVGGFGGLFALDTRRYPVPVLVSSVDGVGTKLKVAFAMGRHDTIGQDLVNHCVNDIAVLGAEPLFFLDYLGTGRLEPRVFDAVLRGFARACAENRCALIGGETAQMPGFYRPGEYDVCGAIVGVVDRSRMLTGKSIRPGDLVLGVASNGLHTNGYSLARRILFHRLQLKIRQRIPEWGLTIGAELLKVHRSYGPLIGHWLRRLNRDPQQPTLKGLAHITGGGVVDNIPRILPARCDVQLRPGSWPIPPVFTFLQHRGRIAAAEMYHVFNMGIGLAAVVAPSVAARAIRLARDAGHETWIVGEVLRGRGSVKIPGVL